MLFFCKPNLLEHISFDDDNLILVYGKVFVTLSVPATSGNARAQNRTEAYSFLEFAGDLAANNTFNSDNLWSLEEIYRFGVQLSEYESTGMKIIIFLGHSVRAISKLIGMIGCNLIMYRGLSYEEVLLTIRPLCTSLLQHHESDSIKNSLRAICCAKCLNWINFTENFDEESEAGLQMDEYMHYARYPI